MLKKVVLATVVALLMNLGLVPFAFASDSTEKEAKFAEKVKSEVAKLGTGADAKIQVKLKDGTKLKGYIREADDAQFVVVDTNGNITPVLYPQVRQVQGNNWSRRVIIGLLIFAPVIIGIIIYSVQSKHGKG